MIEADVLTRMLHAIDARDWAALRGYFADEVITDYTSLWGGTPETVRADDLIAAWRDLILGLSATHHLTGPVVVTDGQAHTHVTAHHWLDGDVWTVHGHYIARIVDGTIAELTLQTFQQVGNRDIPALARDRTAVR